MAQGQATKVKKKKKSVLKRAAQSRQRAEVNRANRTRVRTLMRRLRTAITAGDATASGNLLHPTMSAIDQVPDGRAFLLPAHPRSGSCLRTLPRTRTTKRSPVEREV